MTYFISGHRDLTWGLRKLASLRLKSMISIEDI